MHTDAQGIPEYDDSALAHAAERLGIRLVLAFGSRVRGGRVLSDEERDLDLAFHAGSRWVDLLELYEALQPIFPNVTLDLAILNGADPLFRYEVFRRCEVLYGDPDVFAEYDAYVYRDYVDSADLRALQEALSRKKLDALLNVER